MSQVHVTPGSNKKWAIIAGVVVALGAVVVAVMRTQSDTSIKAGGVSNAASAVAQGSPTASGMQDFSTPEPTASQVQEVLKQQEVAAKEVENQPDLKPLKGPITERPSFVTPMEWAMLQGVMQQHAQPDKELTRMVNFLRFNKQTEALEGLPKTSEMAAKRKALALQLIDDLPERVKHGDYDLKGATTALATWLPDAVPNATERQKRSEEELKRLAAADEVYKAAEAAEAGAAKGKASGKP